MVIEDSAIEDFGPDGIDGGKGADSYCSYRIVMVSCRSHTPLPYSSYEFHLWLRSVPARTGDECWGLICRVPEGLETVSVGRVLFTEADGWVRL